MDADDIMHPQRIEIILKTFQETGCDIILHNYSTNNSKFEYIDKATIRTNELMQCSSGCIRHKDFYKYSNTDLIHHSQSSVKKHIFDKIQYPEEKEFYSKEDCVFCYRVFSIPNVTNSYIANKLSFYKPSRTQI